MNGIRSEPGVVLFRFVVAIKPLQEPCQYYKTTLSTVDTIVNIHINFEDSRQHKPFSLHSVTFAHHARLVFVSAGITEAEIN